MQTAKRKIRIVGALEPSRRSERNIVRNKTRSLERKQCDDELITSTWKSGRCSLAALPKVFGVPRLHNHQTKVISAARMGRDVLLNIPTGGGKTLSFVGAGLVRGGLTLVISPLLALITDQHRRLVEWRIPVRIWTSGVSDSYKAETVEMIQNGWEGFLYATPESLKGEGLSTALVGRVDLAVIDEAHCVLRDVRFRPAYAELGQTLDRIKPSVRFACTATLPACDREVLIRSLSLSYPKIVVQSVARSNVEISIQERSLATLQNILDHHRSESGVIFCSTVENASTLHGRLLNREHDRIALYHGRLSMREKMAAQEAFMSGRSPVMIATDAFLLGIDKSDLRFVAHHDHPASIEDWVQGFGRAGRDDLPAFAYGCFNGDAKGENSRRFLIESSHPPIAYLERVWQYLHRPSRRSMTAEAIAIAAIGKKGKHAGRAIMRAMKQHGLIEANVDSIDKRRRIYRSVGDFNAVDWAPYQGEVNRVMGRFNQLCSLAKLPEAKIPSAIDRYFSEATN